jgi:hypothetical protein
MKIQIEIPDSVVQKVRDKKNLSDEQISYLFKGYIDSCLGVGSHFAYDEFLAWMDNEGEDYLVDFK